MNEPVVLHEWIAQSLEMFLSLCRNAVVHERGRDIVNMGLAATMKTLMSEDLV